MIKPIPGYEGLYSVTDDGQVYSHKSERWLRPGKQQSGYLTVALYTEGKRIQRYVHSLVLLAFVGEIPEGCEVCHNNGMRNDNCLSNLRYDTRAANYADRKLHGTHNDGEQNGRCKLTFEQVLRIKQLHSTGYWTQRKLAQTFDVSHTVIGDIVRGKKWRHVT